MAAERKLYLGRRLRRLRRELGLNQSAMAAEIGVSPSYLNHLERNQRPVTAQVLLRLAEAYDVDLKSFAAEGGEGTERGPARRDLRRSDVRRRSRCRATSWSRWRTMRRRSPTPSRASTPPWSSCGAVRRRTASRTRAPRSARKAGCATIIQAERNHFPYLEEAAETLAGALGDPLAIAEPLRRRLKEGFGDRGADRAARAARRRQASITTCTASG